MPTNRPSIIGLVEGTTKPGKSLTEAVNRGSIASVKQNVRGVMQIELRGEVEQAILSRFKSGSYDSVEQVIAEAFLPTEESSVSDEDAIAQKQKQAADRLLNKLAAMPMESSDGHFSGRDHDRILYGDPHT